MLARKSALITGSLGGIGFTTAKALAELGCEAGLIVKARSVATNNLLVRTIAFGFATAASLHSLCRRWQGVCFT